MRGGPRGGIVEPFPDELATLNDAWKIPAHHSACDACEAVLEPGQLVTTTLVFDDEGPRRRDLCTSCWETSDAGPDAIFWRRERTEAEVAKKRVVDYAMLRDVFTRLLEQDSVVYRRLAYLVGLVLVRKRFLRLQGFEPRDGREVMVVRRKAGDPSIEVPAPFLTAEDIVETREHLMRLLDADLGEGDLPSIEEISPTAESAEDPEAADDEAAAAATTGVEESEPE